MLPDLQPEGMIAQWLCGDVHLRNKARKHIGNYWFAAHSEDSGSNCTFLKAFGRGVDPPLSAELGLMGGRW